MALKNKEKREQSAVASSEVKQRLQVRTPLIIIIIAIVNQPEFRFHFNGIPPGQLPHPLCVCVYVLSYTMSFTRWL